MNTRIARAVCFLTILLSTHSPARSQEKAEISLGADLVSRYVWRGVHQGGASIQPSLGVAYKGFCLTAWGSVEISSDDYKEVEFLLGYSTGGFSVSVSDFFWSGQGAPFYKHYLDNHSLEGTIGYHFGEKFPFYLSWSTFFAGNMDKDENGDRQYSSYLEAGYDFSLGGVDMTASIGAAPWDSRLWLEPDGNKKGFQVSSISLKATKEINISPKYSVPVFVQVVASPATDDGHLVVGITF